MQVHSESMMKAKSSAHQVDRSMLDSLVVVGNGPVGFAFLEKFTSSEKSSKWNVTVFGEEPGPAYDRIRLSEMFQKVNGCHLNFATTAWYSERGIELLSGDLVIAIDREKQIVHSLAGRQVHYHRLVLATGSRPFVPPIPGIKEDGVLVYRTLSDVEKILAHGANAKVAVVLGSGLLGLEAAYALLQMGIETHVVELAAAIMPKQLDNEGAKSLQNQLEKQGLKFHLLHRTQAIVRDGDQFEFQFDRPTSLRCDMVIVAAGIRPRDELATGCSIKVSDRGGIVVNDFLETSDPRIYAIGECAVHREIHYGLVAPGRQMADALAGHLLEHQDVGTFTGSDFSTRLKLVGVDVCTLGDYLQSGTGYEQLTKVDGEAYRKLIIRDGRLVGAILVGQTPELSRLHQAILDEETISFWQRNRFRRSGRVWNQKVAEHISLWPGTAIVCNCMKVTKAQLTEAQHEGFATLAELSACTKAGTVCGSCKTLLCDLVGETTAIEVTQHSNGLLIFSIATLLAIAFWSFLGPIPPAVSVTSSLYRWEVLWNDFLWQQVTGFSSVGLLCLALLFSLRKRWTMLHWGAFGNWRLAHAVLAFSSILVVMLHTGMHYGENFNFSLLMAFLLANLSGSLIGIVTSLSQSRRPSSSLYAQFRSFSFGIHVALFWPLPVLIAFHVVSVYYFGQ